jgi:hypothetical protein
MALTFYYNVFRWVSYLRQWCCCFLTLSRNPCRLLNSWNCEVVERIFPSRRPINHVIPAQPMKLNIWRTYSIVCAVRWWRYRTENGSWKAKDCSLWFSCWGADYNLEYQPILFDFLVSSCFFFAERRNCRGVARLKYSTTPCKAWKEQTIVLSLSMFWVYEVCSLYLWR